MRKSTWKSICLVLIASSCQSTKHAEPLDVTELTISEIHRAYQEERFTSMQLVAAYLDRINKFDTLTNSITAINPDALSIAKALDEEYKRTNQLRPCPM